MGCLSQLAWLRDTVEEASWGSLRASSEGPASSVTAVRGSKSKVEWPLGAGDPRLRVP